MTPRTAIVSVAAGALTLLLAGPSTATPPSTISAAAKTPSTVPLKFNQGLSAARVVTSKLGGSVQRLVSEPTYRSSRRATFMKGSATGKEITLTLNQDLREGKEKQKVGTSTQTLKWNTATETGTGKVTNAGEGYIQVARVRKGPGYRSDTELRVGQSSYSAVNTVETERVVTPALNRAIWGWNPLRRNKVRLDRLRLDKVTLWEEVYGRLTLGDRFKLVRTQRRNSKQDFSMLPKSARSASVERDTRYGITFDGSKRYDIDYATYRALGGK